ncbi:MAG: hypothetical protein RID11_04580 [Roseovarius sp.]|jgi:hypothetical protein|uniref:Chitin binding Peritrophin-A domain-containing protein n=1 Tax=Roseovarius tolerans TaxID=74031 RepID=A0A0L6CV64_9RHOB|nr:hypothetical protein [Roseovarius tolerans]KNX41560.1 hypothetical protein ROTO_18640 [Roseovarius tolerans]
MKLKFGLAALALVAMPSLAMAACSYGKEKQAFSCAQGSTWDSATNTCVPTSS